MKISEIAKQNKTLQRQLDTLSKLFSWSDTVKSLIETSLIIAFQEGYGQRLKEEEVGFMNKLQREIDEQALHKGNYKSMHVEVLKKILNHSLDHDCRCTDPESSCSVCYRAWEEINIRGIDNNHFL